MKLLVLDLIAYGPFTGRTLRFPEDGPNLHIIYGPNEAGKSSALRAFSNGLYGIPIDTADRFLHSYDDLRIGLTIDSVSVIRRKGKSNSLRRADPSETVFPLAEWSELLPVADRDLFERIFGIDQAEVSSGGQQLLASGSDLGALLFAAAGDIDRLRVVRAELKKSSDELFARNAKLPQINKAVAELKKTRSIVKDMLTLAGDYKRLRESLEESESKSKRLEREIGESGMEAARLRRLQHAAPLAAKRRTHIERQMAFDGARDLPADFEAQYRGAQEFLKESNAQIAGCTRDIDGLNAKVDGTKVSYEILNQEHEIGRLFRESAAVKLGVEKRVRAEQAAERLRADALALLASLGVADGLELAAKLRIPDPARKRIFSLSTNKKAVDQDVAAIESERRKASADRDKLSAEQAGLTEAADTQGLEELLATVPPGRDLESEYTSQSQATEAAGLELQRSLSGLPGWRGTLEELASAAVPFAATVAEFQTRISAQETNAALLRNEMARLRNERERAAGDLQTIEQEQAVPTEQDLASARAARDGMWRSIRTGWLAGIAPEDQDRAAAFEGSVQGSDAIADRLRREADRSSRKASLLVAVQRLNEKIRSQESFLEDSGRAEAALNGEWNECWKASGITPRTPAEMQSWLNRRDAIMAHGREVRQNERAVSNLRDTIQSLRAALLSRLAGSSGGAIPALVAQAKGIVAAQAELRQRRLTLRAEEQRLTGAIAGLDDRLRAARDAQTKWKLDWNEATEKLPVRPDASPEEVQVVVDGIAALVKKLAERDELAGQAEQLKLDEDRFRLHVEALTGPASDPFAAIAALNGELQQNRTNRDLLKTFVDQLSEKQGSLQAAHAGAAAAELQLAELCRQAGAGDSAHLPDCIRAAAEKRQLRDTLADLEDNLTSLAAGASMDQLMAEIDAVNLDDLPQRIANMDNRIETLRGQKTEWDQQFGAAKKEIEQKEIAQSAGDAAEEAEYLRARIVNAANEYIRFRLAARILDNAVERFREKNQGPLLQAASELFHQMTSGSFASLRADWNERNEAILVGIRADGRQVGVEGMSDGTRDQLFLSLRLAYILSFCRTRVPAPFIADDILMTFDDDRAVAALRTLEAVSKETQVLLFTHHRHHLDLATAGLPAGSYCVHHLA